MPSRTTSRLIPLLATYGLAMTLLSLAAPDASAQHQAGGGFRSYFANFYGEDFYDRNRPDRLRGFYPRHVDRYGPPMMYTYTYGVTNGYATDLPFPQVRRRYAGNQVQGGVGPSY